MPSKRRLAAIMFTDIVGYTWLMGQNDQKAIELLQQNRTIHKRYINQYGGDLLKEMGDGMLASFSSTSSAVYCAGAIQKASREIEGLKLRIGIHHGEVLMDKNDIYGDGVNVASRIEGLAQPNEILVSEPVYNNVKNRFGIIGDLKGEYELKNVDRPVKVYSVKVEQFPKTGIAQEPKYRKQIVFGVVAALLLTILFIVNPFQGSTTLSSDNVVVQDDNKSIAVLPFVSLSSDPEKQYLADGAMDAILLHLSKIENLRVITRTSVEKYRNTTLSIPEIAAELNVNHLLEGSFQKHGDQANLIVQLSNAQKNEDHLWAEEFNRNWSNIFAVQSEVAQLIAGKLKAVITPEEKQLIEKTPTTNLTAYDFYQRGISEHTRYRLEREIDALEKAEDLYYLALEYDSTFALAYTGLAKVYFDRHYWEGFLSKNLIDSVLILVDKALSFDDQLAEAHVIKGNYYKFNYDREKAISEYDKALKYNPNLVEAYLEKARLHQYDDLVKSIFNYHKAASLYSGPLLPPSLRRLGRAYAIAGFKEKAIYYTKEALKLDGDSAAYYGLLMEIEDGAGNPLKSIEYGQKSFEIDSTNGWVTYLLGIQYMFKGENEEYLNYLKKHQKQIDKLNNPAPFTMFRIGHAYWVNGFKEEAESHFEKGQKFYDEMIKLGRHYILDLHTFYILASINAFLGHKDKAYKYLDIVNQRTRMPIWVVKDFKNDPMFDSLRADQEFQHLVKDVIAKYEAEHERVRIWLEKEGML